MKVSYILVVDEKIVKEVKVKFDKGEDFVKLVKEYLIDIVFKLNGGDFGYFKKGDMVEVFVNKVFLMKVNEVSDLVKIEYGYYIIKVIGKKEV